MPKLDFDSNLVEDSQYELLDKGEYEATIGATSLKPTQSGGQMLVIEYEVGGKKLFDNLNLFPPPNPTEGQLTGQKIAQQTLKKICAAVGKPVIADSEELHGLPLIVKVDVEKGKPYVKDGVEKEGFDRNVIKAYAPVGSGSDIPFPAKAETKATAIAGKKDPWAE